MKPSPRSRGGRPLSFDREDALRRAMELFWKVGYEGATLEDLQTVMGGLSAPSLYNAFGSKEDLFKAAVNLYIAEIGAPPLAALERARTAKEGVAAMLTTAVAGFTRPGAPQGCLLASGATRCSRSGQAVQAYLEAIRRRTPEPIRARIARGVVEGDVPKGADLDTITEFYATVAQGLALRAGDGAGRVALEAAVIGAMAAWDRLMGSASARGTSRKPQTPLGEKQAGQPHQTKRDRRSWRGR
jgi:AcrR family transcriptional regulator